MMTVSTETWSTALLLLLLLLLLFSLSELLVAIRHAHACLPFTNSCVSNEEQLCVFLER
jgi:hypothetical protein